MLVNSSRKVWIRTATLYYIINNELC